MQVAILAGGRATRLRPITETIPKSMVLFEGKPFLEHQIDFLKKGGISHIVLCVGYLSEQIEDYFGDGRQFGIDIRYSHDGSQLLGTAGALKKAENLLENDFFVLYGDSYVFLNFREVFSHYQKMKKLGLMVILKNYSQYDMSNVAAENGIITRYDKKNLTDDLVYIDYGVLVLNKNICNFIPAGQGYPLEDLINKLIKMREMASFETKKRFYEIGSHNGMQEFTQYIVKRRSG